MTDWVSPSGCLHVPTKEKLKWANKHAEDCRIHTQIPIGSDKEYIDMFNSGGREVIILDTETTGITKSDSMIELSMLKCTYDDNGLADIGERFDMYESADIPEHITKLTGITNNMVCGKKFNESGIIDFLGKDPLIIAHNAKFDRGFFERRFPVLDNFRWVCSMDDIDWYSEGYGTKGLNLLLMQEGYYNANAHNALEDCYSVAWLLHITNKANYLIDYGSKALFLYRIESNTYLYKDMLFHAGFKYNFETKRTEKIVPEGMIEETESYLKEHDFHYTSYRITTRGLHK